MKLYIRSKPRLIFGMDDTNYLLNDIPNEALKSTDNSIFGVDRSSMVKCYNASWLLAAFPVYLTHVTQPRVLDEHFNTEVCTII
jgi:hypothetical protein